MLWVTESAIRKNYDPTRNTAVKGIGDFLKSESNAYKMS